MRPRKLAILGCRGIPAKHGGFETFAESLALYLIKHDWSVTVYCQEEGEGGIWETIWQGVRLVHIPVSRSDALGTMVFDLKSTLHAARSEQTILTLGYNTAIFLSRYRFSRHANFINMDGLEWQRAKWSILAKTWLWLNERAACLLADYLIADHPEIKKYLAGRCPEKKITMIPYGADAVVNADEKLINNFNLDAQNFALVIARPEPENSLLEIVSAFSMRKRSFKLAVLGKYLPEKNGYHKKVIEIASPEVLFLGPIYDKKIVDSLRYYCRIYLHGHQVGGTNPSLVEALGAGSPILAQDNRFNRWVAGEGMAYFKGTSECAEKLDALLGDATKLEAMRGAARRRHSEQFSWEKILSKYKNLLEEGPTSLSK